MGRRRRHTAKTGGAATFFRKEAIEESRNDDVDDVLRFDEDDDDDEATSSSDSSVANSVEGILNIEPGDVEESDKDDNDDKRSNSSEDSDGSEEENGIPPSDDDDDEFDEDDDEEVNVRDWGKRRSSYYNGDTADLELGQEDQDAFDEEEAAKEVEATRFQSMTDKDFMLSDDEDDNDNEASISGKKQSGDRTAYSSSRESQRRLTEEHPELLPLLSHFSQTAAEYHNGTHVAVEAILQSEEGTIESIGTNKAGIQFLLTKALVEASTSLHVAVYMLLKREAAKSGLQTSHQAMLTTHPIVSRLASLNKLLQTVDDLSDRNNGELREQMKMVVKAAKSMQDGHSVVDDDDDDGDSSSSHSSEEEGESVGSNQVPQQQLKTAPVDDDDDDDESSDSSDDDDDAAVSRSVLNEARFGLRPGEIVDTPEDSTTATTIRRPAPTLDVGDSGNDGEQVMKHLASTVNTFEQRMSSAKAKKERTVDAEHIDELNDTANTYGRGYDFDNEEDDIDFRHRQSKGGKDDLDEFYSQAVNSSKKRKKAKQDVYGVQPKFPRVDGEIKGERAVSRQILKNRGLVAHKNKLNRNPRVKKREKYRQANIKRHGAVRSVRTNEGHRYAGEETGVKSNISRSRKL